MTVRKRGRFFHYQFRNKGIYHCGVLPSARTKTEAKQLEAEERRKVLLGASNNKNGLENFCKFVQEVYLKYSRENKASWKHDEFRCRMLCEYFVGKKFGEITPLLVVKFIKDRLATPVKRYRQKSPATRQRSPVTVHKEMTLLSTIFLMANREKVATENPCAQVPRAVRKLLRARNRRRCAMSREREQLLLEKGLVGRNAHLKPVVMFELNTGLRLGELGRLEREHVNLESQPKWFEINGESHEVPRDCFIVVKSKNGKPRVIPLNGRARVMAKHQLDDVTIDGYLFPSSKTGGMLKEVKKGFAGACKAAGLKYGQYEADGVTFHTLRHWFNSKLEALGVSKVVRRDLLGHSPQDITDDYTHSTIEQRRRAVELLCHDQGESPRVQDQLWQDCGSGLKAEFRTPLSY
jgi:integrase